MHTNGELYEQDFYAWTQTTADLIRAGKWDDLDREALAEEIESLGKSQYRELGSRLDVLVMHLLKWCYQPRERSGSRRSTIRTQRRELRRLRSDLEQAWRTYLQACEGRCIQGQHESLPLVRLDLDLVDLLVDGQHRRTHRPLGWITQLDFFGDQRTDAQDDDGAMPILCSGGCRCVVQGLQWCAERLPGGGTRGKTDQRQTHDETPYDDKRDVTYSIHCVFSCPRGMEPQGGRSTPPRARALVLCESKKHAILSPDVSTSTEYSF